ncbi:MAG: lipoprotein-releasing ABC transporter permease subunit [Spongiibacteraceae bacterium]
MYQPLSLFIGLRYTRAKRRNQFISFVSLISLLGMILGVTALVVVLSVMNGFEGELRGRILSVVPHGFISGPNKRLDNWEHWQQLAAKSDGVLASAPFIDGNIMLSRSGMVRGAKLYAIDPQEEAQVSKISSSMISGELEQLQPGDYAIVIGEILSRYMGLYLGDEVSVILPQVTVTPMGVFPRVKRFKVTGIFQVGADLDGTTVFIHLADGQKLFQLGDQVKGLRLQFDDLFAAPAYLPKLLSIMPKGTTATSWSETQGSLFRAVAMEKTMVSLLLMIIVLIAALNIVSIVTMMVSDKRSDIAVLRTMGATPATILRIFMIQGVAVGAGGILAGLALGIPLALYVGDVVVWLEHLTGTQVFNPEVYFISRIPSVLEWQDLLHISLWGLLLSVVATIYPSIRASRVHPAEALRYE